MKLYRNWIINEIARVMTKGEHTNERTYVRDRPYIPSTTSLCEGITSKTPLQCLNHNKVRFRTISVANLNFLMSEIFLLIAIKCIKAKIWTLSELMSAGSCMRNQRNAQISQSVSNQLYPAKKSSFFEIFRKLRFTPIFSALKLMKYTFL